MKFLLLGFLLLAAPAFAQDKPAAQETTEILQLKHALFSERLQARYRDIEELQKAVKEIGTELEKRKQAQAPAEKK